MLIRDLAKVISIGVVLLLLAVGSSFADRKGLDPKSGENIDAVLVLDASGSMRVSDPKRLRDEGAKLFIQFLKPGDRLGVIEFSDKANLIRPLSAFDRDKTEEIGKQIGQAGNEGKFTDLYTAVQAAAQMLEQNSRPEANPVIILLSDGKMDPEPSKGSPYTRSLELKNNLLPDLKAKGIKIHTLAFSDKADKGLLAEIALASDGINWFTPDAETIHESFADLFLVVKKPQVLPLTSKGFRIDPDIKEATFYINREKDEPIAIIRPEGEEVTPETNADDIKWYRSNKFDIITVLKPEVGNWQLVGLPKNAGFATVITNLRLTTDWPSSVYAGYENTLQVRLYDNDNPIALPTMTSEIRFAFQITPTDKVSEPIIREKLRDDGKKGDKIPNDGVFAASIKIDQPGEYKLNIVASGPTFERYMTIPFRVKPRLISVEIVAVESGGGHAVSHAKDDHGHDHGEKDAPEKKRASTYDYIRVNLSPEVANFKKVKVVLKAIDEKRKSYEVPLKNDGLRYEAPAAVLPHDGKYTLQATLEAQAKRKKKVKVRSVPIEYTKHTVELDEHQEEVLQHLVEEKPKGPPPKESPLIYIILIVVLNLGAGGYGILQINKLQGQIEGVDAVEFEDLGPYNEALESLQGVLAKEEVDLNDPIFSEENIEKAKEALKGAGPLPTSSSEEGAEAESGEDAEAQDGEAAEDEAPAEGDSAEDASAEEAPAEEAEAAAEEETPPAEEAAEESPAEESTEEASEETPAEEEEEKEE